MRTFLLAASLLPASARLLHSLPEDTYAFPKFRVAFLNSLPVLNATAERWLKEGLPGGELEFLDKPWRDIDRRPSSQPKEIGPGEPHDHTPITTIDDVCPPPSLPTATSLISPS
jgi:protein OS-9